MKLTILVTLLTSIVLPIQTIAQTKKEPKVEPKEEPKFEVYSEVTGDLNHDHKDDKVEVLFKKPNNAYLKISLSDGTLINSPKGICVGCGGAKSLWGEPLGVFSIKNEKLYFNAAGGSRGLWEMELVWQYEKNKKEDKQDFILENGKLKQVDTAEKKEPTIIFYFNFAQKKGVKTILSPNKKSKFCKIPKEFSQISLSNFDFEDFDFEETCSFN